MARVDLGARFSRRLRYWVESRGGSQYPGFATASQHRRSAAYLAYTATRSSFDADSHASSIYNTECDTTTGAAGHSGADSLRPYSSHTR